ncbi:ACT domain-containing protein [Sphingomonas faeni]|uniref:ACT domain-containing protein n=1 Tax=Sphingomonas faeni TaxID=185950 RepID=UPI003D68EFFD
MKLRFVQGRYAVARLSADSPVPDWVSGPGFMAIVRADDELTIVCSDDQVPADVEAERGWVCFRTIGPIPFQATGVVKSLIDPLSSSGIGVFVVCTFDGEHLLVAERDRSKTVDLLIDSGHYFIN